MLMQHSNPDLSLPLQSLVATSQFAEVLATHAKGVYVCFAVALCIAV